jgi:hypothetical protein
MDGNSPLKSCYSSDICTAIPLVDRLSDDEKLRSGDVWSSSKRKNHHASKHTGHNAPRKKQVLLPSFLKLLTVDNYLHYMVKLFMHLSILDC